MESSFLFSAAKGFLEPQEKHQTRPLLVYGQEQTTKFRYDWGTRGEVSYRSKYVFLSAVHVLANKSSLFLRRITASVITRTFLEWKRCPQSCQLARALSTSRLLGLRLHQKPGRVTGVSSHLSPSRKRSEDSALSITRNYWKTTEGPKKLQAWSS